MKQLLQHHQDVLVKKWNMAFTAHRQYGTLSGQCDFCGKFVNGLYLKVFHSPYKDDGKFARLLDPKKNSVCLTDHVLVCTHCRELILYWSPCRCSGEKTVGKE